jgi:hypothetical protein
MQSVKGANKVKVHFKNASKDQTKTMAGVEIAFI